MKTLKKNNISQGSSINSPVPVNKNCDLPPFFNTDYFSHVVVQTLEELESIPCKLRQDGMVATVVQDGYSDYQLQTSRTGFGICDNNAWVKISIGDEVFNGGNLFLFQTEEQANEFMGSTQSKEGQIIYISDLDSYFKFDGQDGLTDAFPNKLDKPTVQGLDNPNYKIPAYLDGKPYWRSSSDFGNGKTVNGKSPDSTGNTDIGIDDTLKVNNITERIIEFEDGGITLDVIDEEGLVDKKFFAYSVREAGTFQIGTGCGKSTGWSAPTFFGWGSLKKLNRNNATNESSNLTAYGFNSLTAFEGGINGGITSIGTATLSKFVGTNDPLSANSYFMTALGVNALYNFLNGSRNTALGGSSGKNLVTGSNNTFTGAASMQALVEGSNNTAIGYQVTSTLKKGSNNTFIGANLQLSKEEVNDTVIIANGTGKQHFKSDDKGSILPYQTIALIDADETGKAVTTKEFVNNKISNFSLPTNWSNPFVRYSGLANKSADATYNRVLVTNSIGQMNYADLLTSEFIKFTENGKVGFALKYRKDNPTFYSAIGNNAVDLSIQTASSRGGASGNDSVAIGLMGKSTGVSSTSLGNSNTASGNNSLAAGTMNTANGSYSLALGYLNTASQGGDNAIGYKNIAKGGYATAMGVMSEATGVQSVAMGTFSMAVGRYSTAIGYGVKSSTELSTAIGNVVESYSHNSIVMGSYNVVKTGQSQTGDPIVPTDDLFVIGNGFKNPTTGIATYSNALEIRNNGHTLLPSTTATMIEGNVKSVITKEYLDIRIPKPPTTGEYTLKSINGVVSWVSI